MALSRVKNWSAEILTADDLNAEFNNIINNAVTLVSPVTAAFDFDGNTITLDSAAVTQLVSSAAVSFNFTSGAKAGTPATTGSVANWSAQTFTDSATAGSGTATAFVAHGIQRPTLAATNASVVTTDAATFYIANSPAAGTNETITSAWALWTDDGKVRHDLTATVASAASAVLRGLYLPAVTETITGSTNITTATGFNLVEIGIPTLSWASNLTITNAATVYIAGAPAAGGAGPAIITNAYSLWVDAGTTRLDGDLVVGGASIPQNSQSDAYTTILSDANKHILHPTADNNPRTFTIDSNANVAYVIGTAITFVNQINTVTIAITSDTMTLAGAGTTGSRTLAASGIATALKVAATSWIISGTGLT